MKIKLMNLFAASFAAATLFSCSNEVEGPAVGNALNPGEARIEINLGGGKTTYSTLEQENSIKDGSGKLFTKMGDEIPFKNASITDEGKFVATVVLPEGKPIVDATLFLYANTAITSIKDGEVGNPMEKFENATVDIALSRTMESLPAGAKIEQLTINEGANNQIGKQQLKRSVARIGAKATKGSIVGYTVSFDKVNVSESTLFKGATNVATEKIAAYPLTGEVVSGEGATKGTEAVAYVYPSKDVEVTVTPLTGTPIVKTFSPELNKNYTLAITPADPTDPEGDTAFDVEIKEWENDTDVDVDFGDPNALTLKTDVTLPAGLSIKNNKLEIAAGTVAANPATGLVFPINQLVAGYEEILILGPSEPLPETPVTRVDKSSVIIAADRRFAIGLDDLSSGAKVYALANYDEDKTYKVTMANDKSEIGYINVVVKGLPKNFLTSFNGIELMSIALTTSIDVTAGIVEEVNNAMGASWAEKLVNFTGISRDNLDKVAGTNYSPTNYARSCPAGFRIPTKADLVKITGRGFVSTLPDQTLTETFASISTGTNKAKTVNVKPEYGDNGYCTTLRDPDNKEYVTVGVTNFSEVVSNGFNRFIAWRNLVQFKYSAGLNNDSKLRCVKESQPDLAYN